MKVRVAWTVDVNDDVRRAINAHYGRPGLANREEVQRWYQSFGESMDMDLLYYGGIETEAKDDE